jgi:DNA-binding NtrC family response regulator
MTEDRRLGILVVDDQTALRNMVARALVRDYFVLAASSGQAALALAAAHPEKLDLLLTDVRMPGMNGQELAEALTRDYPHLRVVYMSGYADIDLPPEATLVKKPFRLDHLKQEIRRALEDGCSEASR